MRPQRRRGVKLGGPKLAQARKTALETIGAAADNHAANVLPIIREIRKAGGTTLREIADALNARGVSTARGGRWHASSVNNVAGARLIWLRAAPERRGAASGML